MLKIKGNKVAVIPIFDADTTTGEAGWTAGEMRYLSEANIKLKNQELIIPDEAKGRCKQGIVKYIGKDVTSVSVGSYVVFSGYTGQMLEIQGEGKLILMPEEFIVAEILDVDFMVSRIYMHDPTGLGEDAFFEAPYSHLMQEVARQYRERFDPLKIKVTKPTSEDYDKMRAS